MPKGPSSHAGVFSRIVFDLSPVRLQHLCLPGDVKQPRNLFIARMLGCFITERYDDAREPLRAADLALLLPGQSVLLF
ncbi:hypothetical protein EYF80_049246 [Liparis tanakae]|uniref:Uncharacterized protein n=1 Tax=Liparis tanakae TaxID=230148 RepID=A0A4Z2FH86_9TELE|nr:hypothetical protein EYF80_049246 [Liparis tanakae]